MWAKLVVLAVVASCYSPHVVVGAPCSPAESNCPEPQWCAPVGGGYACVEGPAADARPDDSPSDTVIDTSMLIDTPIPIDAQPDAAVVPGWQLIQTKGSTNPTTAMAPSGAGNLIIVAVETSHTSLVTSVTDDASNIYVAVPGGRSINTNEVLGLELWYAKNSLPGATAVTATASTHYATVMWEVSGISTTNPLHTVTKLDNQAASTTPLGASITTTVAGEFVVSVAIVANSVDGIHAGNAFTNDHRTYGNGWAHLTDPTAAPGTYTAQWDQNVTGRYCASSAAFFTGP
jgi:hypothetical protein